MIALRVRTRDAHAQVDNAFGRYDLGDRADYGRFLLAHARALPAVEAVLAADPRLPAIRHRTALLQADLASLGQRLPQPLVFAPSSHPAALWGILYVTEGSRLGGGVLAQRVAAALPTRYLQARHEPGEWRAMGEAIDAEATRYDDAWLDEAVLAAEACFDLYEQACAVGAPSSSPLLFRGGEGVVPLF